MPPDHHERRRADDRVTDRLEQHLDRLTETLDVTRQWAAGHEAACEKDREAADKRWRQMEGKVDGIDAKLDALIDARNVGKGARGAWKQMLGGVTALGTLIGMAGAGLYWLWQHVALRTALLALIGSGAGA